ncbi:MAG: dihydrolipoyl dehydrogenase family protein [Geminicoccaceae bacterium]
MDQTTKITTTDVLTPDLCVIGAGSGGLSVAAGAAQMGASVVLIEADLMGGDCLNHGCVPSKSLLAAASWSDLAGDARAFGVRVDTTTDFGQVQAHIRGVIDGIAPHDSVERFEGLGVTVIRDWARFRHGDEVEAGGRRIRARRFVVATGSRPMVPPIEGLGQVPYLTNETIFWVAEQPQHLLVIGAGPIGTEMAQAHRRLGSEVTLIDLGPILPKDDPDLVAVVRNQLQADGVRLIENAKVARAEAPEAGVRITLTGAEGDQIISGSHLLVATGRKAATVDLGLETAGIETNERGIKTDRRLKTTNPKVFAVGDVAGREQFTHMAGHHASVVVRQVLFRLPAKVVERSVPWVTFTDPELAQVGLTEAEAREQHGDAVQVLTEPFTGNDRARAERRTDGLIKLVVDKKGRPLGVSIVGPHAGELILPWSLMIEKKLSLSVMAGIVAPYPTFSEISKRVAGAYFTPKLFSERTAKLVRFLAKFG